MRLLPALVLLFAVAAAPPTRALLIDSGDGTGNTDAPIDDPGWAHVGTLNGRTAVYLGHGWVLSANHVGLGPVTLGGVRYHPIAKSRVQLSNPDASPTDLQLFEVGTVPDLPPLPIRESRPSPGEEVLMIGHGHGRGDARFGLFPVPWRRDGWEWGAPGPMRWGTNRISAVGLDVAMEGVVVRCIVTRFDRDLPTPHEAQAVLGDSGGAVFIRSDAEWKLAGIIFAVDSYATPYERVVVYDLRTYSADLSYYRDQILEVARPIPEGGVGAADADSGDVP